MVLSYCALDDVEINRLLHHLHFLSYELTELEHTGLVTSIHSIAKLNKSGCHNKSLMKSHNRGHFKKTGKVSSYKESQRYAQHCLQGTEEQL